LLGHGVHIARTISTLALSLAAKVLGEVCANAPAWKSKENNPPHPSQRGRGAAMDVGRGARINLV
jgi:hypothetical protein